MGHSYRKPYARRRGWEKSCILYGERAYRHTVNQLLRTTEDFEELDLPSRKNWDRAHPSWPWTIPLLNTCEVEAHDYLYRYGSSRGYNRRCKINPMVTIPYFIGCQCYGNYKSYYRKLIRK